MPIYEYQCADCSRRIERLQRMDDPPPGACESCGGLMQRQISAPAFQFKGTGWYVTDYADRTGPAGDDGSSSSGKSSAKSTSDGASETGSTASAESSDKSPDKSSDKSPAKASEASD